MDETNIQQIKQAIIDEKNNVPELSELNSTSATASYNLMAYIIAKVAWSIAQLWNVFKMEFEQKVRSQKIYTIGWFQQSALDFRLGHPINRLTLQYDDDGTYTQEQINEAMIVSRAAVIELELNNRKTLFIKVAREVDGDLSSLTEAQLSAINDYFGIIKPAGTKLELFSDDADDLRLVLDYEYDPLLMDENGQLIDGTNNTPVQDTIRDYLVNLKFNGEFIISELENRVRALPSCVDREAYVRSAEINYQTPPQWENITSSIVSNSGYMRITQEDLTINFIPKRNVI